MLQCIPLAHKHTLCSHSSQLVFHISAHACTHFMPSVSTAHINTHTHTHTSSDTAEPALCACHHTVRATPLSPSLSLCHLSFNILHLLSVLCLPPHLLSQPLFTFTFFFFFFSPSRPFLPVRLPLISPSAVFLSPPCPCLYSLAG